MESIIMSQADPSDDFIDENNIQKKTEFKFLIELSNYWLKKFQEKEELHLIRACVLF